MSKIAFYTLGCKVNQADTAAMETLFASSGYEIVPFETAADIYLINTCVVTNMGQSKSRKMINRAIRKAPEALIVVTGCYPQTAPEEVAAIAGVDLIIGNQDRDKIVALVADAWQDRRTDTRNKVHKLVQNTAFEELAGGNEADKTRAYLKIQEGCNQYCTYCIIPYARGPLRSRSLENINSEVQQLTQHGYKEVVLIGIHLGCYGQEQPDGANLTQAVAAALAVPSLQRLRLGSLESVEVDAGLLQLMQQDKRLCPHLHLPLQSGSDRILTAMHRPYDRAKFLDLVQKIRVTVPQVALTTDVIVGFPGETEEDFAATCEFVQRCGFAKMHIFPYSQRRGTPAASMTEQVEDKIKQERAEVLAELDKMLHTNYCSQQIGQETQVLWETKTKEGLWEGLTPNYVRVYTAYTGDLSGKIVSTHLDKLYQDGLWGSII
ncbi:MAG: tRNA (N(6)-L-threonylcarbamoyladenosine(37)-C(2))-methylthiotransferase MtaB [Acidaminococcaceae bacterium]|nr:tRNA (N(6)-L-threonylcarbamoyladenosine(37)-C(2))-methylthiotransferase MtaB [Acidaminococcaceae bacterium]